MKDIIIATLLFTTLGVARLGYGQISGVINDADGYSNIRAEQDISSKVVAKVNAGEVFEFNDSEGSPWWKVTLKNGTTGWMYYDRIRFHFSLADLPQGSDTDEISVYGRGKGFDYFKLAKDASNGTPGSMRQFFSIDDTDGAAAEVHAQFFNVVVHLLGDEKLAAFLEKQPIDLQLNIRNQLSSEFTLWPFEPFGYIERNFPKTAKVLLKKEVINWHSPDGKYAVYKVFSDSHAREDSSVEVSRIIDTTTQATLADMSKFDIGTGSAREGQTVWSEDSSHVALYSYDLSDGQTIVLVKDGTSFNEIDLPIGEFSTHEKDKELQGATLIHSLVRPLRWEDSDILVLDCYDYFEKTASDTKEVKGISRNYQMSFRVTPEGAQLLSFTALN